MLAINFCVQAVPIQRIGRSLEDGLLIPELQSNPKESESIINQEPSVDMVANEKPLSSLPGTPLTLPPDLAAAHRRHILQVYGHKPKKVHSSLDKWISSVLDPFTVLSAVNEMSDKLKYWITIVGLVLTLIWNLVMLLFIVSIGGKIVWMCAKVVAALLEMAVAFLRLPKTLLKAIRRKIRKLSRQ